MQKFGGKKYHNLFSNGFVKFMLSEGYSLGHKEELHVLYKDFSENIVDKIKTHPTRAEMAFKGKYPIRIAGGYFRIIKDIEKENKRLLQEISGLNQFYATFFPMVSESRQVNQSEEGIVELLDIWINELYPQILEKLITFTDLEKLNLVFNYPRKSEEFGFTKMINVETFGIRGKTRALLIAKKVADKNYNNLLETYINEFKQYLTNPNEDQTRLLKSINILKSI